jgi:hypothetical protein
MPDTERIGRTMGLIRMTGRWGRPALFVLVAAASALVLLATAFAWFTASDEKVNTFEAPELPFSFEISEAFTPPGATVPGIPVPKAVDVRNTGELPGFVRVAVLVEIVGADGTLLPAGPGDTYTLDGLNTTAWSPPDAKMWAEGDDGWFYYLGRLAPGAVTAQPLMGGVTLAVGLGPDYQGATVKAEVVLEAVEVARWKYREGWWGAASAPTDPTWLKIDGVLSALAQ